MSELRIYYRSGLSTQLLLPIALVICVVLGCKPPNATPITATGPFADLSKLRRDIDGAVKTRKKWQAVDITKLENNAITLHLTYKDMPKSIAEVKDDTDVIARTVLQVLSQQGYDSKKNWLQLFVHAQRHERGASGSPKVRRFGKTMYDFNNDSLQFSEAGSFY